MIFYELITLTVASVYDIKTREIPIILSALSNAVRLFYLAVFCDRQVIIESLLSAFIIFIILFFIAYFGNLGGGDCLIGESIGLYLGFYGLYAIILAVIFSIPQVIYKTVKKDTEPYPFVPYLTAGFVTVLSVLCLFGNKMVFFW